RQPLHETGAQAVNMLLALLSGENVQSPDHLPAVLVPRETTSRARNS
ncbi:hypothetical protein BZG21_38020, partial [Escherichia coli]|nr:hypothetical protein [Escherichia coli]